MSNFKIFIKSILVPVLVGSFVGLIISDSIDYNSLIKPLFSPPGIVFPIVWTILYILMGVSYGLLKVNSLCNPKICLIYYLQLFVNVFWPIWFFKFKFRLFSFGWIIFLVFLVFKMIMLFYKKNVTSALLQIPYLIWILFATYLNLFVYLLN